MASGVVATPIESVEEFKVNTVGQTADFNSSAGAQVMMLTRRGTNDWHGSGYGFYYATNHLGANSWENNHTPFNKGLVPKDPSSPTGLKQCSAGSTYSTGDNNCQLPYTPLIPNHRSRFGFSLGGPLTPWKILGGKREVGRRPEIRSRSVGSFPGLGQGLGIGNAGALLGSIGVRPGPERRRREGRASSGSMV